MTLKYLPLTGLPVGCVPTSVMVCGDPERAAQAAVLMENAELISNRREYHCYAGIVNEKPVAVCSHGIGAPGAAIAFEELIAAGAKRLLRVGTCGALQSGLQAGNLVVVTAAVDNTGYGRETVPPGYPAVADPTLTLALTKAISQAGHLACMGLVLTRDNFYRGVPVSAEPIYQTMSQANILAVEMECSALFIVGTLRQVQTAAVLVVDGNLLAVGQEKMDTSQPGRQAVKEGVATAIRIALDTLSEQSTV
jgi:uridine phosphorylase